MTIHYQSEYTTLHHGNCLDILPGIPDNSIDAIISDPIYPHIKRDYGTLTEFEWSVLMVEVCRQARRILKPTGSAVFVLQPNSRKVGSMRGWLWEFMAWVCREWNLVQDVWWWNYVALPTQGATTQGLLRSSVKACIWCGPPKCYRNQDAVLWTPADETLARIKSDKASGRTGERRTSPSGQTVHTMHRWNGIERRGGSTPFNLLPIQPDGFRKGKQQHIHGAVTPLPLADWWTRYTAPPNSTILDVFCGAGTMQVSGLLHGHKVIGIDQVASYLDISVKRCQEVEMQRRGEMHLRPRLGKVQSVPEGQGTLWDLDQTQP